MAAHTTTEKEPEEQVEEDSEADAEGEVEDDSEMDAEGEEDDEDDDAGEIVGAVKTRAIRRNGRRKVQAEDEDDEDSDAEDADENSDASDSAEEEEDWEAADEEVADDAEEIKNSVGNQCTFCNQDEEHDPGEDFEEYLACAVCGDNAHRYCAREHNALASEEDASHWRCRDCVANGLEEDFKHVPETLASRRRSSAPRMARDLLPSARGLDPKAHSVYNTLILDEDPLDGSRSLRKRKTPTEEPEDVPRPAVRKRQKTEERSLANGEADNDDEALVTVDEITVAGLDGAGDGHSSLPSTGRPQRLKKGRKGARIVSQSDDPKSCIMAFSVSVAQWDEIEKQVQRKQRRRERDKIRRARNASGRGATVEIEEPQHFPAVQTTMYANPFYAFPDRETDENKGKPYGGILTDGEADTARTYPQEPDRKAFQDAREKAEQKWKEKMAKNNADTPARTKQTGLPSKIKCINFGSYEIDTWHAAPYPEEYSRNKHLYICEFCLKYMSSDYVAWRHKLKCSAKHPPGDEIYRNKITNPETGAETTLSFWEVDGRRNPLYCQNLCLLAKLFLGSKTLYYDVEPFLFYIMTENDEFGCHFVGYFSKEKRGLGAPAVVEPDMHADGSQPQVNGGAEHTTPETALDPALSSPGNNVSCILVLPVHMRRGFGRTLIEFSYLLTKVERRTGSPEKPLSDMGLVSYRSYWRAVLCRLLLRFKDKTNGAAQLSITDIAKETGMTFDDIISTLEALRFLVRDPVTRTYAMRLDYDYMKEYVDKHEKKQSIQLDEKRLVWTPYVMGKPTNFFAMGEEATANQPMQTVAPRTEAIEMNGDDASQGLSQSPKFQHELTTGTEAATASIEHTPEPQGDPAGSGPPEDASRTTPAPTSPTRRTSPRRKTPVPNGTSIPHPTTRSATPESSYTTIPNSSSAAIPPTRFEIYPPVPGQQSAAKRRPGRPYRGRKSYGAPYRTTPVRRRTNTPRSAANAANGRESVRRTRSTLGEMVAADQDEDDEQEEKIEDGQQGEDEGGEEDAEGEEGAEGEEDEEIRYE